MKIYTLFISLISLVSFAQADQTWSEYKNKTISIQQQIYGWCSPEKAERLMQLVYETHAELAVEIGVYGGASVYPVAAALKYQNSGVIYGIDPWDVSCSLEGFAKDSPHAISWSNTDHELMYNYYLAMVNSLSVESFIKTLRMTSKMAVTQFADESIDLLHVDGNHSEKGAIADVRLFFPKLKTGGYLMFDDATWDHTQPAVNFLRNDPNFQIDLERSISDGWLVFKKI